MHQEIEKGLQDHLRTDARCILVAGRDGKLPYADNSSVFRALTLFAEHHLLHLIDDGSGMQKYCVCRCGEFKCHHAHLTCTVCHETICLKDTPLPTLNILDGYLVQEAEYVIKVICPKCRKKRNQTT